MATITTTISEKGLLLAEERRFWQDVETISRPIRDRKVHAFANKMVKWLGKAMLEVARDQMEEDDAEEMREDDIKKLIEEDKKSPAEKIQEKATMQALLEAEWGEGGIF